MKTSTKGVLFVGLCLLCLFCAFVGFNVWYGTKFAHRHCIKQTGLAILMYAQDHKGSLPSSTNGFGNALLLLLQPDYLGTTGVALICGPDDDGHIFRQALANKSVVPEDQCSRVYIQGLTETNNSMICVLFDRNSSRGGDHFRSPWGGRVREVCMLDGSMQRIPESYWPQFSEQQVELLVAAGFSRNNAVRFYPAANH